SRFLTSNAITYTQTGGTLNVTTGGNSTNAAGGVDLSSGSNTVSISGGTSPPTHTSTGSANKRAYKPNANPVTVSITGGTLRVGTSSTTAGSTFQIAGYMPGLLVDNTTNTKTAQLFSGSTASRAFGGAINSGSTLNLNALTLTVTGA